jgi:type I restriction enzyme S subunit
MTWPTPPGWTWTPIGELVDATRTQVRADAIDDDCLYVGLEHVEPRAGLYRGVRAGSAGLRSVKLRFARGDLLFGKLRPNLRKCVVAEDDGVCSTDLVPLRPLDPDAAHLLALQLRSEPFIAEVVRRIGGANLPRVSVPDLLTLQLPVPPAGDRDRLHELARTATTTRQAARELTRRVEDVDRAAALSVLGLSPE